MLPLATVVPAALAFERYVLSAFFLYLAGRELLEVRSLGGALLAPAALASGLLGELTRHLLVFLLDALFGLMLLLGRQVRVAPRTWRDVSVPLLASFFYLSYNVASLLPPALSQNLIPLSWRTPLLFTALYLGLAGTALAIWAVAHLGRAFAILVSLKAIVTSGPYRFVRHPIYLSYVLQMLGLLLAYGSPLVLALVSGHLALTVYRARLEEALLAAHSEEYRAYQARTGFLLPRWTGRAALPA
jgi:protein-S-isoprenylcysteine O-methyltransferase Ste14